MAFLSGYKTYIIAAGAVLTALGGLLAGAINITEFIAAVFAALGTMTMRSAIGTPAQTKTTTK